jgi:hypothetical protein
VPQQARDARAAKGIASPAGARPAQLEHMGPENVAPWVVFLATDAARDVNGQLFFVMGGLVALLDYPTPTRTEGRWTPEEIAALFPRTLGMDLVNPAPARDAEPAKG